MRGLLAILLFLSGAAALIDEVVWTRALAPVLGSTAEAVASVLGAFLGGMAVGAWLLGRAAQRSARPLVMYAALELVIGAAALAFPFASRALEHVVLALEPAAEAGSETFAVVRFLSVFILLLPATGAMGGTIPVLSRIVARRDDSLGREVGFLYAVNTAGAVLGCLLAGFVLIPTLGLRASLQIAAAVNVFVALAAFAWSRRTTARQRAPSPARAAPRSPAALRSPAGIIALAAFAISGFTALGYEILWTRALVFHVKSLTYGFSFMLATFLAGLALGSLAASRWKLRERGAALPFVLVQMAAGAFACMMLRILLGNAEALRAIAPSPGGALASAYAPLAFLVVVTILPAGLFFGATFPLAVRLLAPHADRAARDVGRAAAANTAGAVAGAFATGFLLVPYLGVAASTRILAGANAAAAAGVALLLLKRRARAFALAGSAVFVLAVLPGGDFFARALERLRPGRLVFLDEGRDVTVTVHEEMDRSEKIRTIYVNGSSYTGTRFFARRYMKAMGHVPLLVANDRSDALVICLGTGMTLSALARHDAPTRLLCAELSSGVKHALPLFDEVNDRVAANPRASIAIEDGRHFLMKDDTLWDVVTLEPPPPLNAGVNDLYSREFYALVKSQLAAGGVLCQWFPLHSQTPDEWKMGVATFLSVFPDATLWLPVGRNAFAIGIHEGGEPWTFAQLAARAREPKVAEGLAEIGFPSPESLLSSFVLGPEELSSLVAGAPLITDDRPRLEFHDLSRAGERFDSSTILREILERKIDAREWLDARGRAAGIDAAEWARTFAATDRFFRGAFLFEMRQQDAATKDWAEAYRLEPRNAYWRSILGIEP